MASDDDAQRILTPLGRLQAEQTGKRLAEMLAHDERFGSASTVVHVSSMARAKETADIICKALPADLISRTPPSDLLREGTPAHVLPERSAPSKRRQLSVHNDGPRIEAAFRKIFHRERLSAEASVAKAAAIKAAKTASKEAAAAAAAAAEGNKEGGSPAKDGGEGAKGAAAVTTTKKKGKPTRHTVDIVVCHGNVIRYFVCRALQLPPEAWLRMCTFNCSLTYLTCKPSGSVSLRLLGDVGHLPMDLVTFSEHHGFAW